MRKVIGAINMTLDGVCDHTALDADDQLHQHYIELLNSGGILLYGRITYQLMEDYWPAVLKNPTGSKATDEFAIAIDRVPKIVFSRTLKSVGWDTAQLAKKSIEEEVMELKHSGEGGTKDILVGSRSLIISLLNLNLIDEFQLTVQPTIAGSGLPLFKDINDRITLKLLKTKILESSGSVTFYYEPGKKAGTA
jgi:dihydrofolate reductase